MNFRKRLNKKKKTKTFLVGYVRMYLEQNMPRSYVWKESTMIKLFNTHQFQLIGKLVTPGLLVTVARLKCTQNKRKVHTNTVHAFVKQIIPIQCYNCTECNSTFDGRHKLKKHTREQHEGKFVKSPRTEPKTNIKISN